MGSQECLDTRIDAQKVRLIVDRLARNTNGQVLIYLAEFLQDLGMPENVKTTKMTLSNLATIFTPLLFRCPYDDPAIILQNNDYETDFVLAVLQNWSRDDACAK